MAVRFCWANMTIGGITKILRALNLPTSGRSKQSMGHKEPKEGETIAIQVNGTQQKGTKFTIYVCECVCVCDTVVTLARFPLEVDR